MAPILKYKHYGKSFSLRHPTVLQEGYQDDRGEDHPGARSYETNRDVKWICKMLHRMETQDEEFEGRIRALERLSGGESRRRAPALDGQRRGRRGRGRGGGGAGEGIQRVIGHTGFQAQCPLPGKAMAI